MVLVREIGAIDNAAYREINRADTLDASTHLRHLRKMDLLVKKGSGSRSYYVPGPVFVASLARAEAWRNRHAHGGVLGSGIIAGTSRPETERNSPDSAKNAVASRKAMPESRKLPMELTTEQLPHDLSVEVTALHKRPSQDQLRKLIRHLCAWQPLNSVQLSHLLGRQREPLVRDHLKPMIDACQLTYAIPEMLNHPDQAYVAVLEEDRP
jgi:ATP-dependent DNA helicase RecG